MNYLRQKKESNFFRSVVAVKTGEILNRLVKKCRSSVVEDRTKICFTKRNDFPRLDLIHFTQL